MARKSPVQGKKRSLGGPVSAKRGSMTVDPMDQFKKASKPPATPKAKGVVGMTSGKNGNLKLSYKPLAGGKGTLVKKKAPKSTLVSAKKGSMKVDPMDQFKKPKATKTKKTAAAKASAPSKPKKKTAAGVARRLRAAANKERKAGDKMIAMAAKLQSGGANAARPGFQKAIVAERKISKIEKIQASTKARKGSGFAAFSKKASKVSAGKSSGSGKRTRSFSESKIKRDANGRFASKGASAKAA